MRCASVLRVSSRPVCRRVSIWFVQFHGTVLYIYAKYDSLLGSNALVCCAKYGWSIVSFSLCLVQLSNTFFEQWYLNSLTEKEMFAIVSLLDIMFIREGYSVLPDYLNLSNSQINDIITAIATA
jgi:hypothetical protein